MTQESVTRAHPYCGRHGELYYMLSRLMFFNGYFYVSVDLATSGERIVDVDLELSEETLGCRKTRGEPQYLTDLPDSLDVSSYVFDGLLAETGERKHYERDLKLIVRLSGGTEIAFTGEDLKRTYPEQYNPAVNSLWKRLRETSSGGKLLELGARGPTSIAFRGRLPEQWDYAGLDIKDGENIEYVGDAHRLSEFIEPGSVDIVYSSSVFEHLAAPWLVALECAKILKVGGLMFTGTHNTWPLHEAPWDYWRFTKYSWASMFNSRTGFRILDTSMCELTKIVPVVMGPNRSEMPASNGGWTGTSCLAEKTVEPTAIWDGYITDTETMYPD